MNKDRQRRYYERNREKILKRNKLKRKKQKLAKNEPKASIFAGPMQLVSKLSERFIGKILIGFLVLCCTVFLISESTRTMKAIEGEGALAKAILCELVLIGISMLSATSQAMKVLRAFALVGISLLAILNTLGAPLNEFSQAVRGVGARKAEIAALSNSIAEKRQLLNRYLSTDRVTGARRIELEVSTLNDRLSDLQREASAEKSEYILILGFIVTVLYRLVIMAANIVFANRLGELMQRVKTRPNLVLIQT